MASLEPKVSDFGEIRLLSEILLPDVTKRAGEKNDDCADVLPIKRASWNLVKFVFREENGREEAVYG
jgi:hypothetical protein